MEGMPTYAGIDVAQDRLDVVLRPSGEYLEATNDEVGIGSVVSRLRKDVDLVVLEATGGLEQPAAAALAVAGVPVAVVNPGRSGTSPRPTGSTPRCSPTSPRCVGGSPAQREELDRWLSSG
jgi:transposase